MACEIVLYPYGGRPNPTTINWPSKSLALHRHADVIISRSDCIALTIALTTVTSLALAVVIALALADLYSM